MFSKKNIRIISIILMLIFTSCNYNTTETYSIQNTETTSSAATISETTTAYKTKTEQTYEIYEPPVEIVDPLKDGEWLNDSFCYVYNYDTSRIYLVIDGEIKDHLNTFGVVDKGFNSAVNASNESRLDDAYVDFNIPPVVEANGRFFIAIDYEIKKLNFLVNGKEFEFKYVAGSVPARVFPLSDTSFVTYIHPKNVWNPEIWGFEGKIIYTYNPENHTFEGEIPQNDKAAATVVKELYDSVVTFNFDIEYNMGNGYSTRNNASFESVNIDNFQNKYIKSELEGYRTRDEFTEHLKTIFTDELAEETFRKLADDSNGDPYITEKDGDLYFIDEFRYIYRGISDEYFDIVSVSDEIIEARIVEYCQGKGFYEYYLWEPGMILENTENGWRISQNPFEWWLNL